MSGSGDRRADQAAGFWFPPWRQQTMRPNPRPTQTTQTVATPPPQLAPATGKPAPTTRPPGSTAPSTQPAGGSTSTTSQAPRRPAPSQTQSQSPPKPASPPQQTKVSPKLPPPSSTEPQTPTQIQPSTNRKSEPQITTSPVEPKPQPTPTTTTPPTSHIEKSKPQGVHLPPIVPEAERRPPPMPDRKKPEITEVTHKPIPDASTEPASIKETQAQSTLLAESPISFKSATPQAQEAFKDSKSNLQLTFPIQEVPPSSRPHPEPEERRETKIIEVEPAKSDATQSATKHIDEPQPIPIPEVPKSATTVEIVSRTSQTDSSPKQLKSEDGEKADKHMLEKQDHGTKSDSATQLPHQGTETRKETHQEKQKETVSHDDLTVSNSGAKESKTVVQVKQKDKHLESEVYRQEKLQNVAEGGHRDAKEGVTKLLHKKSDGRQTKSGEEEPVRVVTLAGENRGAQMEISNGGSKRRDGVLHIHRDHNNLVSEDKAGQISEDEESQRFFQDSEKTFRAYINNNTQSVNNSILYHSACNSNNPGVHLNVTNNTTERMWHPRRDGQGGIHDNKPSGITSQAQRLTVEPSVGGRRFLHPLFWESGDNSDLENISKPRRHGC